MRHKINPMVDCVFKKLLGSEENKDLTIHFLNAVCAPLEHPIVDITFLNPINDKDALDDKLTVVDIKAEDTRGRTFQVEVQLRTEGAMRSRVSYTWAQIYGKQLSGPRPYERLQPVISIWLLGGALIPGSPRPRHRFQLCDPASGVYLDRESAIHVLEVPRWRGAPVEDEVDRWLRFLHDGERLDPTHLPGWMETPQMHRAMEVLMVFSESDREWDRYVRRMDFQRILAGLEPEHREAVLRMAALHQQIELKEALLDAKDAEIEAKGAEIAAKGAEIAARDAEIEARDAEIEARDAEIEAQRIAAQTSEQLAGETQARLDRAREALRALGIDPDSV